MQYSDLVTQQRREKALLIERAMIAAQWRLYAAAQILGMGASNLRRILERASRSEPDSPLSVIYAMYRKRCKGPGSPNRKRQRRG